MEGTDEAVEYAKKSILDIRNALLSMIPSNLQSDARRAAWIGDNVYDQHKVRWVIALQLVSLMGCLENL